MAGGAQAVGLPDRHALRGVSRRRPGNMPSREGEIVLDVQRGADQCWPSLVTEILYRPATAAVLSILLVSPASKAAEGHLNLSRQGLSHRESLLVVLAKEPEARRRQHDQHRTDIVHHRPDDGADQS